MIRSLYGNFFRNNLTEEEATKRQAYQTRIKETEAECQNLAAAKISVTPENKEEAEQINAAIDERIILLRAACFSEAWIPFTELDKKKYKAFCMQYGKDFARLREDIIANIRSVTIDDYKENIANLAVELNRIFDQGKLSLEREKEEIKSKAHKDEQDKWNEKLDEICIKILENEEARNKALQRENFDDFCKTLLSFYNKDIYKFLYYVIRSNFLDEEHNSFDWNDDTQAAAYELLGEQQAQMLEATWKASFQCVLSAIEEQAEALGYKKPAEESGESAALITTENGFVINPSQLNKITKIDQAVSSFSSFSYSESEFVEADGQFTLTKLLNAGTNQITGKEIYNTMSLVMEDSEDVSIKGKKKLTPKHWRLLDSLAAAYNANECHITTLSALSRSCEGKLTGDVGGNQLKKYRALLEDLNNTRVYFDNSQEMSAKFSKPVFAKDGSRLAQYRYLDIENEGKTDTVIKIFEEPVTTSYARDRKEITSYPVAMLNIGFNMNDNTIAIQNYIIKRIARMKSQERSENAGTKILLSTLLNATGCKTAYLKKQAPAKVAAMLDSCVRHNWCISKWYAIDERGKKISSCERTPYAYVVELKE